MIDRYLKKDDNRPRIVNVCNKADLRILIEHYSLAGKVVSTLDYSKKDENPSEAALWKDITNNKSNLFIIGFPSYWKLKGRAEVKTQLLKIASFTGQTGHVVIFCYQCNDYLDFCASSSQYVLYDVTGDADERAKIVFTTPELPVPENVGCVEGIHNLIQALETNANTYIYVKTKKSKGDYPSSVYQINEEKCAYDVLCKLDSLTCRLSEDYATEAEWSIALQKIVKYGNWYAFIKSVFFDPEHLEQSLYRYKNFDDSQKKLYFLALKMFNAKHNWCLNECSIRMQNINEFTKTAYRCLLTKDIKDADFWDKYNSRKEVLSYLESSAFETVDFCKYARSKADKEIYYLNSATDIEKGEIIEYLDKYGESLKKDKLVEILEHVYPDLADYLKDYHFKVDLFDTYFSNYKYLKVINKVTEEFKSIVEEQAVKREYNKLLNPRSTVVSKLNKEDSMAVFMDAMGVEYLGYIIAKCQKLNMGVKIKVARATLPSLTYCNKDFVTDFEEAGCEVVSNKLLDEIKHHGKENYDYEKKQQPLHLVEELNIVRNVLQYAETKLSKNEVKRIYLIADHGASRLAVINESVLPIEANTKGKNGGRICPVTEDTNSIPASATKTEEYYVLANYDRFKGGRKASVEVHGGATLEEIMVPIVELYLQDEAENIMIEIFMQKTEYATRFKKPVKVEFFSKTELEEPYVVIGDKQYIAVTEDGNNYTAQTDIQKKGEYIMDVYDGDNIVKEGLKFTAVNAGMSSNNIL